MAVALFCASVVSAREQSEEFLTGLRERGMHEQALEYLDQMQTSPLADQAFRDRIGFHRGSILIDQARAMPDREQREALFDQAQSELDRLVTAHPDYGSGDEAQTDFANLLVEQGKVLMAEADELPTGGAFAGNRGELTGSARRLFDDAIPRFEKAAEFYNAALDKLPKTLDPKTQSA